MKLQDKYNEKVDIYFDKINYSVAKFVEPNKKILDVGCSVGKLGKYLIKNREAEVYGIDVSDKAIREAKGVLHKAVVVDIENSKIPFKKRSFDIIICADVLEHLYDPLSALKKLSLYLKGDGIFILSIPNIANIKIRYELLRGRFDYTNSGIMDNTHIRFFTKKNVEKLASDAGLKIENMDYTIGFSFLLLRDEIIGNNKYLQGLKYELNKLFPSLTCTQFIVVAAKK